MKRILLTAGLGILTSFSIFHSPFSIPPAEAAGPITYRHKHFLYTIDPASHPEWRTPSETWLINGVPFEPPAFWRVDGDTVPPLPAGVERQETFIWNRNTIRSTLETIVGTALRRPAGNVTISRTGTGLIVFDGVGLPGRDVDTDATARLTVAALEQNLTEIELPVTETQPEIHVNDEKLRAAGITEVVTVGESDFSRSPVNRRHNIAVGLNRFNGHYIEPGAVFSFTTILGKVDGTTGYRKELVIKGDRTEPDYGGGLCQISTTAYRGVWEYGLPILKRKNHSYTVSHYFPPGTDATVYPGSVDMVFQNDMRSALLLQTYKEGDLAFFIYYGTKDGRSTELLGPFISNRRLPPPDKTEFTTDLAPGERKKLNERVPGLHALWYRFVTSANGEVHRETIFSIYEARSLFTAIGVAALPPGYLPGGATGDALLGGDSIPTDASTLSSSKKSSSSVPKKPSTRR
ncbi:hypothetical protein EXS70_04175 [Candidatus Peribacteria bacterium]|nr:hypothetical protein [Candidatus Peribacteria bacterium]